MRASHRTCRVYRLAAAADVVGDGVHEDDGVPAAPPRRIGLDVRDGDHVTGGGELGKGNGLAVDVQLEPSEIVVPGHDGSVHLGECGAPGGRSHLWQARKMSETPGIAELYLLAHASFDDLASSLSDDDWTTSVPCTPGWTVRDVLSHVSGVPDDALAGRMEGAPGEAWTAAQIERNRHAGVAELLARWAEQTPVFATAIESMGEHRPPFDAHSHEHDVRHAIGRPGDRSNLIVQTAGFGLASIDGVGVRVTVELDDQRAVVSGALGSAASVTLRGVSVFELFRSRLGRRSREQVRNYEWTGTAADIETVIDRWFNFGPSPLPIEE